MTQPYPRTPTFLTIDEPFRFEGECFDLEVEGRIPPELDGTFFDGEDGVVGSHANARARMPLCSALAAKDVAVRAATALSMVNLRMKFP